MVFTSEHKRFIIESYLRNGGEWIYSAAACKISIKTGTVAELQFRAVLSMS
jgi:hypothetical protein